MRLLIKLVVFKKIHLTKLKLFSIICTILVISNVLIIITSTLKVGPAFIIRHPIQMLEFWLLTDLTYLPLLERISLEKIIKF